MGPLRLTLLILGYESMMNVSQLSAKMNDKNEQITDEKIVLELTEKSEKYAEMLDIAVNEPDFIFRSLYFNSALTS